MSAAFSGCDDRSADKAVIKVVLDKSLLLLSVCLP